MALVYYTFVQTPSYARAARTLIADDDQRAIEAAICADPRGGDLEAGVRKIRVPLSGRGKRGGARVVYYVVERKGRVYLLEIFPKNVKIALSAAEKIEIRKVTRVLEGER